MIENRVVAGLVFYICMKERSKDTMKKLIKRKAAFLVMAALFTLLAGMNVSAKTYNKTKGIPSWDSSEHRLCKGQASPVSELRSSNKKVAEVVCKKVKSGYSVYLKIKKPGTTKVTYKIKNKGKTDTYRVTVNVYGNPFKLVKIGKAAYTSQFSHGDYSTLCKGSGKLQVKLKKEWAIKSIKVQKSGKWTNVKVGAKVNVKKISQLKITVKNKKYGFSRSYYIFGEAIG